MDSRPQIIDVVVGLVFGQQFICGWIKQMVQPQFNIVLHINPNRSQVFISIDNYDRLILSEGRQELSLMWGEVLFATSPLEKALQSL
jgi:hypothetical protein